MVSHTERAQAIRFLSMDAVEQANSGHPGMPMGMADIAQVLWHDFLKHNPVNPLWPNRDRFVLSNGHGSMLLYSLLHLSGYDLSIEDLKQFRQLHSKTPGHPEYGETPGVETTTGPLGQGLANAVGMAMAEARLAQEFNRDEFKIVDHHTYVFLGDGCLMEGISHEACSLAGTFKLGKLIAFWDDNQVSIDGNTAGWFTDNTPERFKAYHWHVQTVDGHDADAIKKAIACAQAVTDQPSLICCKTTIGYGAPSLAGTAHIHGAPMGADEIAKTRAALQWPYAAFEIPDAIYQSWNACARGKILETEWQNLFTAYQHKFPELAREFSRRLSQELPNDFHTRSEQFIQSLQTQLRKNATRKSSLACIEAYSEWLPEVLGGSADLSGSNCTKRKAATIFKDAQHTGNYIHYGVREFGMSAIMNGLALHGGFIPFGGTFLVFSDYARNAVRLSALMKQRVIYVYTHDSIGLGEDGPTHQPISHITSLRALPGLSVWRPCDEVETAVAWQQALMMQAPSALLLTRQDLACQTRSAQQLSQIRLGAYVLIDCESPTTILMATGSEVELAVRAALELNQQGAAVRVVSMPCMELFEAQDAAYKAQIFPQHIKHRIAIEAGSPDLWYKYVGLEGRVLGIDRYGLSGPYEQVYAALNLTTAAIKETVLSMKE